MDSPFVLSLSLLLSYPGDPRWSESVNIFDDEEGGKGLSVKGATEKGAKRLREKGG